MNNRFLPFLTIGIPTWNRAFYLEKNIIALIKQIESAQLSNVEILISDNASQDNTQLMCEAFAGTHSFITYHRQPTNLGANTNFQTVIELAKGQYVWLLGDDDLLVDNITTKVIQDLQHYAPDICLGPAIFCNTQKKATHLSITHLTTMNINQFANENIIEMAGKISGIIFKKESVTPCLSVAKPIIRHTKTPWPHLAWLLLLLQDSKKQVLILPYGTNQLVSENWHNLLFTGKALIQIHFIDYQNLLTTLKPLLAENIYKKLIARTISSRKNILFKCVLYATYLDTYSSTLKSSLEFFPNIIGIKNKFAFLFYLILPLFAPKKLRKFILHFCNLLLCKKVKKLNQTIARLIQAEKILKNKKEESRQQFSNAQL